MAEELPGHARAVVIGAGVIGASVAYHLTLLGWRDVVVVERHQAGCGTTWHSAGNIVRLESSPTFMDLFRIGGEIIRRLEGETGQAIGWRNCGRVMVAKTPGRLAELKRIAALGRRLGTECHILSPAEVGERLPIARTDDIAGGAFSPGDGRVNPTDITAAYLKGARSRGAKLVEDCRVTGILVERGRAAGVHTTKGTIRAEAVVNCCGLWSREVGAMAGVAVPLHAVEHFYMLTRPLPGVSPDMPTFRDPDALIYGREEVGGLLLGCFDEGAKALPVSALPPDFSFGLLPEDWDQFGKYMDAAVHRIPALAQAEVKSLINGPESFTPDGSPLVGEAPELPGFWVLAGLNSSGITTSGGASHALAHWMVEGDPGLDATALDIRRFHEAQNGHAFLKARVSEMPSFHFMVHGPGHDFTTGRRLRVSPLYERMSKAGARFQTVAGYERPAFFDSPTHVAAEVKAAREGVALFDLSGWVKLRLAGPGAAAALAAWGEVPAPGRGTRLLALGSRKNVEAMPFAIADEDGFLLLDEPEQCRRLPALLRDQVGEQAAAVADLSPGFALFCLVGPDARTVLGTSPEEGEVVACHAGRATGRAWGGADGGLWLLVPAEQAVTAHDALTSEGVLASGHMTWETLRLANRRPSWASDLGGRLTAAEARPEAGPATRRLCAFRALPGQGAIEGREPVFRGGRAVGLVTSAAWLPDEGCFALLALVEEDGADGTWSVDVAGEERPLEPSGGP